MKGSREQKRRMSILRKRCASGNGVVPFWAMDDPQLFKLERCKKWRGRHRRSRDGFIEVKA